MGLFERFLGRARAPETPPRGEPLRVAQVEGVLAGLRPYFLADGGDIRLVAVEEDWVEVRLVGACGSCHVSDTTIWGALEPRLKEELSWVRGVRTV